MDCFRNYAITKPWLVDMAKKKSDVSFEAALQELEQLVERMEQGDLSLEESLQCFERGVGLTRACQQLLQDAEQKVHILLNRNDQETLEPFTDGQ